MKGSASPHVMAGHSRSKNGVLSHAYVPAIHVFRFREAAKTWVPGLKPGMTKYIIRPVHDA